MPYDDSERHRHPGHHPGREPHPQGRTAGGGGGGIPDGLLVGVLAFLLGLTVFVWTATGLAGLLTHGAWPDDVTFGKTPLAVRELVTEPHDITGAWPSTPSEQLPGYGLFWGIFISQLMVLIVLTIFVMGTIARARAVRRARRILRERDGGWGRDSGREGERLRKGERRQEEDAGRGEALREHTGAETGRPVHGEPGGRVGRGEPEEAPAPAEQLPNSNPGGPTTSGGPTSGTSRGPGGPASSLSPLAPGFLGAAGAAAMADHGSDRRADGTTYAGRVERDEDGDPVTHILEAPGAALVSAPTPALWAATKTARAKLGPVHLFDPTHACDTPDRLRWSPHHGCADRATAASRAAALLAPLRSPRPIDATVHTTAETVLRCWLHAAALEKRPFREVHRWALATTGQTADAVQILRTHPKSSSGAAGELEAALAGHPQVRADAVALIRGALAPLGRLHVRNACSAERADRLALESFIAEAGTLYVVGEEPDVLPLLNALTQSVVEHGRRMAARSSDGRLDPPLTTVLHLPAKL
ncbi:hypothetical protein [Streptomyces spirodelae]|uniref:Type VI secretion protein n=1 Tax=Streptomyces spirodelae TaxID=2812904 RepID=A0ABS3WY25_9ACTN|nr:hypothetical protein [Streptomyces spirodelae]MBO8188022.1 hypothetical protein [Streptomyces spirodelae]